MYWQLRLQKCTRSGVLESMALHFLLARGESHIPLKILLCFVGLRTFFPPKLEKKRETRTPAAQQTYRIRLHSTFRVVRCLDEHCVQCHPNHPLFQTSRRSPCCHGAPTPGPATISQSHGCLVPSSSSLPHEFQGRNNLLERVDFGALQKKQTPLTCRSIRAKPLWLAHLPLAPFAPSNLRHE